MHALYIYISIYIYTLQPYAGYMGPMPPMDGPVQKEIITLKSCVLYPPPPSKYYYYYYYYCYFYFFYNNTHYFSISWYLVKTI